MKVEHIFAITVAVLTLLGTAYIVKTADAALTSNGPTVQRDSFRYFTFFTATTTNATSTNTADGGGFFQIAGAKRVELYFSRQAATTSNIGTTTFTVQVSPDGSQWYDYKKLVQPTTTVTSINYQPSAAIANATTSINYGMDLEKDAFFAMRCIANIGYLDGANTCRAYAEF